MSLVSCVLRDTAMKKINIIKGKALGTRAANCSASYFSLSVTTKYKVRINYRRILQNHIFTNTEQKYTMLLPFERGMFAVS